MRRTTRAFALGFALACFYIPSASAAPEMPPKVKILLDNLLAADRGTIWPGYSPLLQPVAVHLKGRGSYLVGTAAAPGGCAPVRGFSRPVCFFRNKEADAVVSDFSASYYTPEAGNVFLYNYANKSPLDAGNIIVHETFHLFQHSVFKDAPLRQFPVSAGKDLAAGYKSDLRLIRDWWKQLRFRKDDKTPLTPDINDVALAYMEDKLLFQALSDKRNYKTSAAEFVRLRDYRRGRLSQRLLECELKQERIEGSAEYAGWKSSAMEFLPMLAENYQAGMLLSPQPLANNDRRFYSPGAAQGFLLDRLGVPWKTRVQAGEDVFAVMKESFPPDQSARDIKTLLRDLDSVWVKKALAAQARELDAKRQRAITGIKEYDGWKLVFYNNLECGGNSRICYDEAIELGDGNSYMDACHTELQCKGLDLSIDKPIIQGAREITVLLGTAPEFAVNIDGAKLPHVPAMAAFQKLNLETDGLTLNLDRKGQIRVVQKTIMVEPSSAHTGK